MSGGDRAAMPAGAYVGSPLRGRSLRVGGFAVALVVAIVLPFVTSDTALTIAIFTVLFMAAATAWNTFSGFSGYISIGHGIFFGIGEYTLALISTKANMAPGLTMFVLVPVAGIVAGLVAVPIGLLALRARRHTFIVITIAMFFIFQQLAYNLGFTGGTAGILVPFPVWSPTLFNRYFYFAALIVLVIAVLVACAVRYSRFGLHLMAIRDDEDRALSLGVSVGRVKLTALVLSAVSVGMVGAVYAYYVGQVFPQFAFDPLFDVVIILMVFFGGLGTLVGPLIGALILESLQQYVTLTFSNSTVYLVVYGCLLLGVVLFMPSGVVPTIGRLFTRQRTRVARFAGDAET